MFYLKCWRCLVTAARYPFDTNYSVVTFISSLKEFCEWFYEVQTALPLQYSNLHPRDVYPETEASGSESGGAKADDKNGSKSEDKVEEDSKGEAASDAESKDGK